MKKGISLIVLVITVTSTYSETTKYRKVPPKNKIETKRKIINIGEVVDFDVCYFNFYYIKIKKYDIIETK